MLFQKQLQTRLVSNRLNEKQNKMRLVSTETETRKEKQEMKLVSPISAKHWSAALVLCNLIPSPSFFLTMDNEIMVLATNLKLNYNRSSFHGQYWYRTAEIWLSVLKGPV